MLRILLLLAAVLGLVATAQAPAGAGKPPQGAPPPATNVAPADMTGRWRGTIRYDNGMRGFSFVYTLTARGDSFTGNSTEPNTFGNPGAPQLFARITGRVLADGRVEWTKQYDGTGGVSHPVTYSGRFNQQRTVITGRWNAGGNTGDFEMRRE